MKLWKREPRPYVQYKGGIFETREERNVIIGVLLLVLANIIYDFATGNTTIDVPPYDFTMPSDFDPSLYP